MEHFFPDPMFAWIFFAALAAITGGAAVVDLRTYTIPKKLTLTMLGLGVLFSVVRLTWIGAARPGYTVPDLGLYVSDVWTGAAIGLLYAVVGVLLGFGLFFVMWILGTCGGGDVKLFAALGAWGGVMLTLFLLLGTIFFVVVLAVSRLAYGAMFGRGAKATLRDYSLQGATAKGRRAGAQGAGDFNRPKRRLMAYSLAAALSVVVVCLWVFRADLFGAAWRPSSAVTGPAGDHRVALRLEK
jgi:prepilin peptidase CpaA